MKYCVKILCQFKKYICPKLYTDWIYKKAQT